MAEEVLINFNDIVEDDDQPTLVTASKPKKRETRVIKYEEEGNSLEVSSMKHIMLPFFTKRTKNRNVNLTYEIKHLNIKMKAKLDTDEELDIKQPGEFEENIYNYLMGKLYEEFKMKIKGDVVDENQLRSFIVNTPIKFEIKELISELGLKYSTAYNTKVRKALENLKGTTYSFQRIGKTAKKGKIFKFDNMDGNLINFERLTVGKKAYYKVVLGNEIAVEAFQNNFLMHFESTVMRELNKKSPAARKIYEFIAMNRFKRDEGEAKLLVLATIIPYEVVREVKSNGKNYIRDERKAVFKKIISHFKTIKDMGLLKSYKRLTDERGREIVSYVFGERLGIVTDYTLSINKVDLPAPSRNESIDDAVIVEEKPIAGIAKDDGIIKAINKAKRNVFVSKSWNKRVDNKIEKIIEEEGEKYAVQILDDLYKNLNMEINTTLVQYINGILKNKKKREKEGKKGQMKLEVKPIEALIPEKKVDVKVVEVEPVGDPITMAEDPMSKLLYESFLKWPEEDKKPVIEKARNYYLKITNSKSFNTIHEKIFSTMEKLYVVEILKKGVN